MEADRKPQSPRPPQRETPEPSEESNAHAVRNASPLEFLAGQQKSSSFLDSQRDSAAIRAIYHRSVLLFNPARDMTQKEASELRVL